MADKLFYLLDGLSLFLSLILFYLAKESHLIRFSWSSMQNFPLLGVSHLDMIKINNYNQVGLR